MTERNAGSMGGHGAAWHYGGYCGRGNVEGLFGSLRGRPAVVCGNAESVFKDYERALEQLDNPVVFAVNDIGMYLPRVDHWVSLHEKRLFHWAALRSDGSSKSMGNLDFATHSIGSDPAITYGWQGLTPLFALSGYFAMQIAWLMEAEKIVLCGCPGDTTPRFFEAGPRTDNFDYQSDGVIQQLRAEMDRLPEFRARVRSMSGQTKEFFGGV